MSREVIKNHLWNKLHEWSESLGYKVSADEVLSHCFVAGGAIASLVRGEPVNDYDVYFTDVAVAQRVVDLMRDYWNATHKERQIEHYQVLPLGEEPDRDNLRSTGPITKEAITPDTPKYAPVCFTPNAITLNNQIQLIIRFIGEPEEITKRFDFAHTQCWYKVSGNTLVMPPQALESLATHELIYTGSDYPLSSIIRTKKYIQRGWNVNAGQYLKMALQLHSLDFTNPKVLAEQLVGVDLEYFHQLISTVKDVKAAKNGTTSLNFNRVGESAPNFYDPFNADDEMSVGHTILDVICQLWD